VDLRGCQTRAVEEILGDLRADPERHLAVLHHPDQHLRGPVGSHDQPLRRAPPYMGRSAAVLVADHSPVVGLPLASLPSGRVALHLITVGGSSAHLDSLWLRFLPAMISSLLQASELARQLSDPGRRVFDGPHGAVVRDLDRRNVSGDHPVTLSQPSQRASRVVRRDHTARDLLAKFPGFGDHFAKGLFGVAGRDGCSLS
jgi:hypothetical protein